MFAQQLRDELEAMGSAGTTGPSSSASTLEARTVHAEDSEQNRTEPATRTSPCAADADEQATPMLADVVFAVALLPVVSVIMWHLLDRGLMVISVWMSL